MVGNVSQANAQETAKSEPHTVRSSCKVRLSETTLQRIQKQCKKTRQIMKGRNRRRFITLKPEHIIDDVKSFLAANRTFRMFLESRSALTCVHACLLHFSNDFHRQQPMHRDHKEGYGKYVTMVFSLDETKVDTLILTADGSLLPANCNTLMYDAFHLHAGPECSFQNKVFVSFSDTNRCDFAKIARAMGHGVRKSYNSLSISKDHN